MVMSDNKCTFEGCGRKYHANGLCNGHYVQKYIRNEELSPLGGRGARPKFDGVPMGHITIRVPLSDIAAIEEITKRERISISEAARLIVSAGIAALRGKR
jgi:hypothetical protein